MFHELLRRAWRGAPTFVLAALLMFPATAQAYAGPGAGISALGTLFAIVSAIFLAIVGFIWYPVKRLIRWLKGAPRDAGPADE